MRAVQMLAHPLAVLWGSAQEFANGRFACHGDGLSGRNSHRSGTGMLGAPTWIKVLSPNGGGRSVLTQPPADGGGSMGIQA